MVTVYTIAFNEELLIEFFIEHYRKVFTGCHIVVYDNQSTDRTKEIALSYGCEVIEYNSNNEVRDDLYLEIKNNCWKNSKTDWVLVCDVDELLQMTEQELALETCSIVRSKGYNMINLESDFTLDVKYGIRAEQYDKYYLFNKKFILDINYEAGCHRAKPEGLIKFSENAYRLYHYSMLSPDYVINRYRQNQKRLSATNKLMGWGTHYNETEQQIIDKFIVARNWFSENSVDNEKTIQI